MFVDSPLSPSNGLNYKLNDEILQCSKHNTEEENFRSIAKKFSLSIAKIYVKLLLDFLKRNQIFLEAVMLELIIA